jgi:hypothetical protein
MPKVVPDFDAKARRKRLGRAGLVEYFVAAQLYHPSFIAPALSPQLYRQGLSDPALRKSLTLRHFDPLSAPLPFAMGC